MFSKNKRLANLRQVRQDISQLLQKEIQQHNISIRELSQITGWSELYWQAVLEAKANLSISDVNYLASIFECHLKLEFTQ